MPNIDPYDIGYQRFADYLGVDRYDRYNPKVIDKLGNIYRIISKISKVESTKEVAKEALNVKREIGTTLQGKEMVDELYTWLRLVDDGERAQKVLKGEPVENVQEKGKEFKEKQEKIKKESDKISRKSKRVATKTLREHKESVKTEKPRLSDLEIDDTSFKIEEIKDA